MKTEQFGIYIPIEIKTI